MKWFCCLSVVLFSCCAQAAGDRPNLIYILADDAGIGDFGCYGGNMIRTPNIDRVAAEGMKFTNAYSGSAVCAPTRNVLMTGFHNGHALFRANKESLFLPSGTVTVAAVLKQQGYATGGFGKWGLGKPGTQGVAEKQGFDLFFGYYDQVHAHSYFTDHLVRNSRDEIQPKGSYSHDVIEAETLKFIEANATRPFFVYAAYTLPHAKFEMPPQDPILKSYAGKPWPEKQKTYAAMVGRLDASVGKILAKLKELKIDDRTIVIFSSDNGCAFSGPLNSSAGLRGIKRSLYEGGIRTPLLARWPGKIKPGGTSDFLTGHVDFMKTAAELAGASSGVAGDGISIAGLLSGGSPPPDRDFLYWEIHEGKFQQAVRSGKWKACRAGLKDPVELYDLSKDPGERNNVAPTHPDVVAKMAVIMDREHTDTPNWKTPEHSSSAGKVGKKDRKKTNQTR